MSTYQSSSAAIGSSCIVRSAVSIRQIPATVPTTGQIWPRGNKS